METSVVTGLLIAALGLIFAIAAGIAGHREKWRIFPTTGIILLGLLFTALGILSAVTSAKKPAAGLSQLPPKEEYFYRVRWEGGTKDGKTLLLAEDSSGTLYWAEISEPLGVKEVPVMAKEKFTPLLPLPEKKKSAKSGN